MPLAEHAKTFPHEAIRAQKTKIKVSDNKNNSAMTIRCQIMIIFALLTKESPPAAAGCTLMSTRASARKIS